MLDSYTSLRTPEVRGGGLLKIQRKKIKNIGFLVEITEDKEVITIGCGNGKVITQLGGGDLGRVATIILNDRDAILAGDHQMSIS